MPPHWGNADRGTMSKHVQEQSRMDAGSSEAVVTRHKLPCEAVAGWAEETRAQEPGLWMETGACPDPHEATLCRTYDPDIRFDAAGPSYCCDLSSPQPIIGRQESSRNKHSLLSIAGLFDNNKLPLLQSVIPGCSDKYSSSVSVHLPSPPFRLASPPFCVPHSASRCAH